MRRAFAELALLALLLAGCGDRTLDLSLSAPACAINIPAGGSVFYEISGVATCSGCLTAASAVTDLAALSSLLRQAGACAGLHPDSTFNVKLIAWDSPTCQTNEMNKVLCGITDTAVRVPNGRSDAAVQVPLTCRPPSNCP